MQSSLSAPHAPVAPVPLAARTTMALGGALLAGALSSFGQAVPGLSSLANSAGPWFLVALALVLLVRPRRWWVAMPLGVVVLELMHVGYWATTVLRGFPDVLSITNFWVLIGIPAGLLAGAVALAVRSPDGRWRGAALGVTAAVLIGEGARALLQVADTTGVAFWVVEIVAGAVVLVLGVLTARSPSGRVLALGTGVVGTAGVLSALLLLGG